MNMNEFAEVMQKSKIVGKCKVEIIYKLFCYAGAKSAGEEKLIQSPAESTIQKWLSNENNKPNGKSYFPESKIKDKDKAHQLFTKSVNKDKWIELRDLFKQWHNDHPEDEGFYIDTETDEIIAFSTSFWKQFTTFFIALRMWDDAEEQYSVMEGERGNFSNSLVNEMISVFREQYRCHRVYEFIPKDIKSIIESIYIYRNILDEYAESITQEGAVSDSNTIVELCKIYFKWFPKFDCFVFHEAFYHEQYVGLKISEGYIIFKFDEDFDNEMPIGTGQVRNCKYAFFNQGTFEEQFDDETSIWKESQVEIITIGIDVSSNEDYSVIDDCHELIDGMLELNSLIDNFIIVINEKIIKKYENVTFDNNSRLLYNNIKLFGKSLKKFKKYLTKFRDLKKKKDEYLLDQALIKSFGMYTSFGDYKTSSKPVYPFSECYLNPEEADKVESNLRYYHKSLRELYAEISSYGKNDMT